MVKWAKDRLGPLLAIVIVTLLFGYQLYSTRAILPEVWIGVVVGLAIAAVHIGMAVWIYQDAKKRGHEKPAEWAIVPLVPMIGLFGLLLYLSVRNSLEAEA